MKQNKTKKNNYLLVVSMVFTIGMLFYAQTPSFVVICVLTAFMSYIFFTFYKEFKLEEALFLSIIISIPTSTVSIIGTSTARLPLSWFHLMSILLLFIIVYKYKIDSGYFLLIFIFVSIEIVISISMPSIYDSLKQLLMMTLFLSSFIIGSVISKKLSKGMTIIAADCYVCSTIAFGIQVILQRAFIMKTGVLVGQYAAMGLGRKAYAGLMGDYSFATLYIATGCLIVIIQYLDWRQIKLVRFMIEELILLAAMISVTSRTGIAALAFILVLYLLCRIKRIGWRSVLLIVAGFVAVPVVLNEYLVSRGGQRFWDSSGRIINNFTALYYYQEHPFLGIGLGINNFRSILPIGIPHNFFVQYLTQIGLIGLGIIIIIFIRFLRKDYNKNNELKWVFWLIVVGSMLIPDIFSSRFFFVIVIMSMFPKYEKRDSI